MKNLKTSLKIIVLFSTAIIVSLIPDHFHQFFGDWYCIGSTINYVESKNSVFAERIVNGCQYSKSAHDPEWHWGWRHILFFIMGIVLFVYQVYDFFGKEHENS